MQDGVTWMADTANHAVGQLNEQMQGLLQSEDHNKHVLEKATGKDDFQKKRLRCITNPERARETLKPYAQLEITVRCAQRLLPRPSWVGSAYCDASVDVYLDDIKLEEKDMRTLTVHGTLNPLWQQQINVGIIAPSSMLRLQVVDDQLTTKVDIGFVEFCIGDIPYDREISGWFELRYQENLKTTSLQRYASHCAVREDMLWNESSLAEAEMANDNTSKSTKSSIVTTTFTKEDLKARKHAGVVALQKTRTMAHSCMHACSKKSNDGLDDHERGNAGEVFLTLRLKKLVADSDATFALAVDPPPPVAFGDYVAEDDGPKIRKAMDLQKVMDTLADAKQDLVEDCLACIYYTVKYIGSWRSPLLSLPITIFFFAGVVHAYWGSLAFPAGLAMILIATSREKLRFDMTRGGLNAMLTEEGFKQVAKWQNSKETSRFLKRIAEDDLGGMVQDIGRLQSLAATVTKDGVPVVPLKDLRGVLQQDKKMIKFEASIPGFFLPGDKVLVEGRRRAVVQSVSQAQVQVVFQDVLEGTGETEDDADGNEGQAPSPQPIAMDPVPEWVDKSKVRKRNELPYVQTAGARLVTPTSIANTLMDLQEKLEKIKRSGVYQVIDMLTGIFTWRRRALSLGITLLCILLAMFFVFVEIVYQWNLAEKQSGHDDGNWEALETFADWLITFLRNIDNLILFAIVFALFVSNAGWFCAVKSALKMISRLGRERSRHAPQMWSFYREDPEMARCLRDLPIMKKQTGGSMFEVPDFDIIQRRLSNVRGLSQFKFPNVMHPANNAVVNNDDE